MSAVVKLSDAALSANVDRLGVLNAEIADLKKKADAIKDKLIASGESEVFGKAYKAVIVAKSSVKLDSKKAKALLSAKQIADCSKLIDSISVSLYDI